MAVTAWLANYPYSDPIFQFFQVQQYLTQPGVNPVTTYTVAFSPGVVSEPSELPAAATETSPHHMIPGAVLVPEPEEPEAEPEPAKPARTRVTQRSKN